MKEYMKRNLLILHRSRNVLCSIVSLSLLVSIPVAFSSSYQIAEIIQTPGERELFNTLPGERNEGGILDATNPMELMNRLRRATAMDNATPPSDAIDQALQALEQNESDINSNDKP